MTQNYTVLLFSSSTYSQYFKSETRFLIFWSYPGEAGQMKLTLTVGEQKLKVSPWKSASTSLTSPCIVASTNKFFWSIFQKFGYFSEFFNQNYLIVRIFFLLLFLYVSLVFFQIMWNFSKFVKILNLQSIFPDLGYFFRILPKKGGNWVRRFPLTMCNHAYHHQRHL